MLGCYFAIGLIFPPSEEEAARYFRIAADAGVADAQYDLGVLLLLGKEPIQSEKEAVHYFKLAAEQEHPDAQYNLGVCYYQGLGVCVSQEEAIRYLELAVKQKQAKAAEALERVLLAAHPPQRHIT